MQIPQQNYHTYYQTNQVNFTHYLASIWYIVKLYSNVPEDNEQSYSSQICNLPSVSYLPNIQICMMQTQQQ